MSSPLPNLNPFLGTCLHPEVFCGIFFCFCLVFCSRLIVLYMKPLLFEKLRDFWVPERTLANDLLLLLGVRILNCW